MRLRLAAPNWSISYYLVSPELAWNVILSCSGSLISNSVTPLLATFSDDYKDVAVDNTGPVSETTPVIFTTPDNDILEKSKNTIKDDQDEASTQGGFVEDIPEDLQTDPPDTSESINEAALPGIVIQDRANPEDTSGRVEEMADEEPPVPPKRGNSGKRVSFNKKIGVRTFETQVSDISEEKQPIESPDLSILTKKDTPSYVSFKTAEEYTHQEALEKQDVRDQRTAEKELIDQSSAKKPEVKVNTESKMLKIKSFFSKQKEEKQPEKIWSKFSFGKLTSKSEPQGKSAEEARLEAEAEALNNLIRQQEEEKAKETSVTKPTSILKHQQEAIKEEKETKAFQEVSQQEEPMVKSLQQREEEEEEGNKLSMIKHHEECSEGETSNVTFQEEEARLETETTSLKRKKEGQEINEPLLGEKTNTQEPSQASVRKAHGAVTREENLKKKEERETETFPQVTQQEEGKNSEESGVQSLQHTQEEEQVPKQEVGVEVEVIRDESLKKEEMRETKAFQQVTQREERKERQGSEVQPLPQTQEEDFQVTQQEVRLDAQQSEMLLMQQSQEEEADVSQLNNVTRDDEVMPKQSGILNQQEESSVEEILNTDKPEEMQNIDQLDKITLSQSEMQSEAEIEEEERDKSLLNQNEHTEDFQENLETGNGSYYYRDDN